MKIIIKRLSWNLDFNNSILKCVEYNRHDKCRQIAEILPVRRKGPSYQIDNRIRIHSQYPLGFHMDKIFFIRTSIKITISI